MCACGGSAPAPADSGRPDGGSLPADAGLASVDGGVIPSDAGVVAPADAGVVAAADAGVIAAADAGVIAAADAGVIAAADAGVIAAADAGVGGVCGPLSPVPDGSGITAPLLIALVAPGASIVLYNDGDVGIALGQSDYFFCTPEVCTPLLDLADGVTVPAHGRAMLPWPATYTASNAAGEVALLRQPSILETQMVAFVCWGQEQPGSRRAAATLLHKWTGNCADPLSLAAIRRLPATAGNATAAFDVTSAPATCP